MTDRKYTGSAAPCVALVIREPLKSYRTKRKPNKVKTATVQKQFYFNATKDNPNQNSRPIPWINLKGFWLKQAGFEIGATYKIEVFKKKLVLTVEKN